MADRYLLLLHAAGERPEPDSAASRATLEANAAFMARLHERGVLVDAAPLDAPATGTIVRHGADGEPLVSCGPFAETREWIAGYYLVECDDLDEVVAIAHECPGCTGHGAIEIRPLLDVSALS